MIYVFAHMYMYCACMHSDIYLCVCVLEAPEQASWSENP